MNLIMSQTPLIVAEKLRLSVLLASTFVWPNMAVKGTRQTQALLKVCCLFGVVGFGSAHQLARPLLVR